MYASVFDLRPQPGEMVVSRSDVKRRRKEGSILQESIQGSPKRYKIQVYITLKLAPWNRVLLDKLMTMNVFCMSLHFSPFPYLWFGEVNRTWL
jgi:hypothetical protein